METLSFIVDLLSVLVGLIFIYLNIRSARSIVGSVFKKYHRWMIVGATCFTLGFLSDADFTGFLGINTNISEIVHHIFLLAAAIVFVLTNLYLPKEASEYMGQPKTGA